MRIRLVRHFTALAITILSLVVRPTLQQTGPSHQSSSDGDIVVVTRSDKGVKLAAPCPDGLPFCNATDDEYPKDQMRDMLKNQPRYILNQFNLEEDIVEEYDVHDKGGFGGTEHHLCVSEPKLVYPEKAKSKDGNFELVVNLPGYKQGIKTETCSSTKNQGGCQLPGSLPLNYSSHCAQKYVLRSLVVLDRGSADGAGFITKPFEFPSCCSCSIFMH